MENITITQQSISSNKKEQIDVINIEKDNRFTYLFTEIAKTHQTFKMAKLLAKRKSEKQ